ncbi:MAG: class I SAM-dependent rRNA methyltransferase, partial [Cyanobacteria bacterium]|nr:class I SAM-dependent rRNA methyltransferase [Cyanobacteriota bacterium]
RAGASVDAVDSSAAAVDRIAKHASRNGLTAVRAIASDVKQFLRGLGQARRRYECVIADPPAFAKQIRQKEEATRAYHDLNLRALSAVAPDGLFVSCSCSQAISESDLMSVIRSAAQESRKSLTLLEKRGQSVDHRALLQIPETSYLKCLYFSVSGNW